MAKKATSSRKAADAAKKSAMTKPALTKARESKPAGKKAPEKKPAEKPAVAKKTAEAKPKKAPEKKPAEKPAAAKKTAEKKPVAKAAEKKPAEKKPAAKKAPEKTADAAPASAKPASVKPASVKPPAAKVVDAAPPAPLARDVGERIVKTPVPGDITIDDAKRILAEVESRRNETKGACRAALPLSFVNMRAPEAAAELGPIERRQLVAAGADGMGEARTPEDWLTDDQESYKGSLEIWDVVDAHGIPVYSVWMYLTDNGTVFRAGTIDVVGGVSQSGLECAEEGLEEALLDAQARLDKGVLKRSLLRFMG